MGLLFALMPVLAAVSEGGQVSASALAFVLGQLALVLAGTVGAAALVARAVLPRAARLLARHSRCVLWGRRRALVPCMLALCVLVLWN